MNNAFKELLVESGVAVERRKHTRPNIGVFGVGHYAYWPQFEGLYEKMEEKQAVFINMLSQYQANVEDFGIIDDAKSAYDLVPRLKAANLDILFCDMLTYATSSTFGTIVKNLDVPIVLVALQPDKALNYEQASTFLQLYNDDICSLPEFAGVAMRMGKPIPDTIIGHLHGDDAVLEEIDNYYRIACVLHDLKSARIGHIGHPLESMLDMHSDPTMLTAFFGPHFVQCEEHEITTKYDEVEACELNSMKERILDFFDTPDPVSDPISLKLTEEDLELAARVAVALEKFVEEKELDGLAYYYEGHADSLTRKVMTNLIVGNSLLTGAGFPMCGESDLKTCLAMLIFDRLGIGGSFAEFHPIDFNDDFVLVGHDGPHNIAIANGRPIIRSLDRFHGKPGSGAGVEFNIKVGPITMLSIGSTADGKPKFVIAEGYSEDGPIPPTGNTNTRGRFVPDVRTFLKKWIAEGPTHHFALGVGHKAKLIQKLAEYLGVEAVIV